MLERYWTRFAFSYEAAYLSPGPTCPLQTWLSGQPLELDDAPLRDALDALVEGEGDAGAGLVSPKRPLMVAGASPSGDEGEALMRFLLARLVALPQPPPAPRPERHSLGFGFGRRRPPPLKKDLLKVADEPRKTSWGLASPLSWVGFAASAPTSRSATPAPVPTPTPTVGPGPSGLSKSVGEKEKPEPSTPERSTPRPAGAAHKPRWPSLGISFGDAVGNVGAVFGLSSSPKPESRLSQEIGRGGTATPAESAASEAKTGEECADDVKEGAEEATPAPAASESDAKVPEGSEEAKEGDPDRLELPPAVSAAAPEDAKPEEPPQTSQEEAAKLDLAPPANEEVSPASPELTSAAEDHPAGIAATPLETTPGDTQTPTPVVAPTELPAEPTSAPAEPVPAPAESTLSPAEAPSTPTRPRSLALSLDDGASVTGSQASVADLDAAIHSDVDTAWESRAVYLRGQRRRLFWVIVSFLVLVHS